MKGGEMFFFKFRKKGRKNNSLFGISMKIDFLGKSRKIDIPKLEPKFDT